MAKAIDETQRRRDIQHAYNVKHGIEPKALIKKILDVMDVGEDASPQDNLQLIRKESKKFLVRKKLPRKLSSFKSMDLRLHFYLKTKNQR
jgi:excinuclease ABC subunit B